MQKVEKKIHHAFRHGRWVLLGSAVLLLLAGCVVYVLASRPAQLMPEEYVSPAGELHTYDAADVARMRITLRSGDSWSAVQAENGVLMVEGEDGFAVETSRAERLLNAVRIVSYEDVFTDDAAAYSDRLGDFGLDPARVVAEITYTDGTVCTLRLGDPCQAQEGRVYYMTVDGDDRLFALDRGTAEDLVTERALLYPVKQPVLHKARFDRIVFAGAGGTVQAEWRLQGSIGSNATDRWLVTNPVHYPADGEAMTSLISNLANIRLGAYVGEATAENMTRYGLDEPRFTLTIHQAAGSIGTTNEEGQYTATDWPEESFTLAVGGVRNESVDYVMTDGNIYISSHYSLQTLMDWNAEATVSRYPVQVALGNLSSLTVERDGEAASYVLTRENRGGETAVSGENDGSTVEVTCTLNGERIPYAGFEAAYNTLLTATVTGRLPEDWVLQERPHTIFTFEDITGVTHTVALSPFDALHDAVLVDGYAMFYMIRGGLAFAPPAK